MTYNDIIQIRNHYNYIFQSEKKLNNLNNEIPNLLIKANEYLNKFNYLINLDSKNSDLKKYFDKTNIIITNFKLLLDNVNNLLKDIRTFYSYTDFIAYNDILTGKVVYPDIYNSVVEKKIFEIDNFANQIIERIRDISYNYNKYLNMLKDLEGDLKSAEKFASKEGIKYMLKSTTETISGWKGYIKYGLIIAGIGIIGFYTMPFIKPFLISLEKKVKRG